MLDKEVATAPLMRPFLTLRYLVREGINILALPSINPDLYTDNASAWIKSAGRSVVYICSQSVQRHAAFGKLLTAAHFIATQTAGNFNTDALGARAHTSTHRLLNSPSESNASL